MSKPDHLSDNKLLDAIEQYLSRLESMVRERAGAPEFFDVLTRGLVRHCGASTVGVWLVENQRPRCLTGSNGYQATLSDALLEKLKATGDRNEAKLIAVEANGEELDGPRLLSSSPIHKDSRLILDLWSGQSKSHWNTADLNEIVRGVTDLAVSFSLRTRLDDLSQQLVQQQAINELLAASHRYGNLEDQSQALAVSLLRGLDRDRVSVLQVTVAGARILALEPSANLNQRSTQLALLCKLATAVASESGWLIVRIGEGLELSPRVKPIVDQYLQASLAREIWVLSTGLCQGDTQRSYGSEHGVIILEKFTLDPVLQPQLKRELFVEHPVDSLNHETMRDTSYRETLLSHALNTMLKQLSLRKSLPLRLADRWLSSTLMRRLLVFGLACSLLLLLLFLIPSRIKFAVEGSLQPKSSRSIFATRNGVVEELYVRHAESVSQDQPLLKIRSPDLELELQKLIGQLETLEAKLLSLRSGKMKQGSDRASENSLRLSAEEEDLKIQLLGVRKQLEIVKTDQESLTLLSPLKGKVDSWEIEPSLIQRPVFHGQKLLQIYTPEDGWQLDLEIPDDVAGFILEAQQAAPCKVEFRFRSDPSRSYTSTLSSISETTQVNTAQRAVVFAKVDLSKEFIDVTRSGAMVAAQIDCGRSTLGFIWFREIMELLQRSFWF